MGTINAEFLQAGCPISSVKVPKKLKALMPINKKYHPTGLTHC